MLIAITTCGCKPELLTPTPEIDRELILNTYERLLIQKRETIRQWALTCKEAPYTGQYSEQEKECHQGDMASWAGYGCLAATLSGDHETAKARCSDIAKAQGADGRWWRGPTLVDKETTNTFSRDMTLGLLAYFLATKDTAAAKRWIQWVYDNKKALCKTSTDNRCMIVPGIWGLMYQVWLKMELEPTQEMKNDDVSYTYLFQFEGNSTPIGYQLHLLSVNLLLRKIMDYYEDEVGKGGGEVARSAIQKTSKKVYERQPDNPFFDFVANGPTERVIKRTLELCPDTKPDYSKNNGGSDWSWQRDTKEQTWRISVGHDCITLVNWILADLKGNIPSP